MARVMLIVAVLIALALQVVAQTKLPPAPFAKPGVCPGQKDVLCNGQRCRSDSDCLGQLKCCQVQNCVRNCVNPVPRIKPGKCPRYRRGIPCVRHIDECIRDPDCKANLKCCKVYSRCGRKCVLPEDPCKNFICPASRPRCIARGNQPVCLHALQYPCEGHMCPSTRPYCILKNNKPICIQLGK